MPTLSGLECITDHTASMLAQRERRIIEYAEQMEVIIQTHNRACYDPD